MLINLKKISRITLLLIISGCSSIPNNIGGNFQTTFNAISSLIYGYEDYPISQELVDEIPYASIRIKIGKGPAGLMILESVSGNKYTWVSSDGIYISLMEGRIVKAYGLENNLVNYESSDPTFKELLLTDDLIESRVRYISLDNPQVFDLPIKVSYKKVGLEQVTILDKDYELMQIQEKIENTYIRWKFTNNYWVDPQTGFVWQSRQTIAPNLPPFFIQVTKKPSL